jgi:geranylgeranyl diphosphate synthase type 3
MFYLTLTFAETGGLFMLAVRLLQLFSEDGRDYSKLVSLIGLFFQIRDDYSNLTSDEVVSLHETHNCIVVVHKMEDDS